MSQYEDVNRSKGKQTEDFLRLLMPIQGKIYGYILSRWPNRVDADDIMQETVATIWKKFDTYKSGTDFQAWAITIAKFTVMSYQKKNIHKPIQFNEEAMRILESQSDSFIKQFNARLDVLSDCVKKLNREDKHLLEMKYLKELPAKRIAVRFDVSSRAIYKKLSRIHTILMRCVRLSLAEEVL